MLRGAHGHSDMNLALDQCVQELSRVWFRTGDRVDHNEWLTTKSKDDLLDR